MDLPLQTHDKGHSVRGLCHGFRPLCDKLLQHFYMDKSYLCPVQQTWQNGY
jgi:hypothetical protein